MSNKLKLKPISQELILDRLKFENPWWVSGSIDSDFDEMQRRLYFDLFFPLVEELDIKRAVVLMGSRRVGKTVMMHHSVAKLLQKGVNKHNICFIGIDTLYI